MAKVLVSILFTLLIQYIGADPKAKEVIRAMDAIISNHIQWNNWTQWNHLMKKFWTKDMVYDSNFSPNEDLGNSTGIREWWDREHIPFNIAFDNTTFNQLIFASDNITATTTTYALAKWKGQIATIPPTHTTVRIRIFDFYQMGGEKGEKIAYNWMLLDTVHLMLQAGYRVLPKPFLEEGLHLPPKAMDGIPAPISRYTDARHSKIAKNVVQRALFYDWLTGNESASELWNNDMLWYGPVGFGLARSKKDYEKYFLKPMRNALSKRKLKIDILTCEGNYCGAHGYLYAMHTGEWLGEPATNAHVHLRFGMHWRIDIENRKIPEGWAMFDLPAFFIQIGLNLYDRMNLSNSRIATY